MIDFTVPVYIDDLLGIIPFKVERDSAVVIRPFGWRVWLALIATTPLYLLSVWFADLIYKVWHVVCIRHSCILPGNLSKGPD